MYFSFLLRGKNTYQKKKIKKINNNSTTIAYAYEHKIILKNVISMKCDEFAAAL